MISPFFLKNAKKIKRHRQRIETTQRIIKKFLSVGLFLSVGVFSLFGCGASALGDNFKNSLK
jgi:hypothetical protein